jgi:hypothetical protein
LIRVFVGLSVSFGIAAVLVVSVIQRSRVRTHKVVGLVVSL